MLCTLTKADVDQKYHLQESVFCREFAEMTYYLVSFDEKNDIAGFAEWPEWKPNVFLKQCDFGDPELLQWRRVIKVKRSWVIYPGAIGEGGRYSHVKVRPFKQE